ncbi:glycosyltransferase family 2 protein [Streptomyces sp. NPDC016845]|uniref:glycosyltransferase family 2 protein n=1 Tax=Streptomyces sp. NPDC016845 TaxID=3364972 RepID=UPI0037B066E3
MRRARLSVIVPVCNVELYLEECPRSLADRTFTDSEAVMVDDGSTDASAEIAEAWAARDSRSRLISRAGQGLGAACDAGVRALGPDTEYPAFVDSDDTLPPGAYELMAETLDETGSDLCAGNVTRFRSAGHVQSPVHRAPFAATRPRTHISRFRPLLTDRTDPRGLPVPHKLKICPTVHRRMDELAGFTAVVDPGRFKRGGRWVDGVVRHVRIAVAGARATPRRVVDRIPQRNGGEA